MTGSAAGGVDARYVAARRVLLDALTALAPHGAAVIVAGAQAVYLRAGSGELAVAPYTTDGDLAIDPTLLDEAPQLEDAMHAAGFQLSLVDGHVEPGIWVASTAIDGVEVMIPVDLIVPEQAAPPGGRRGARLGVHGRRAARRATGLEAALVDHSPITIAALETGIPGPSRRRSPARARCWSPRPTRSTTGWSAADRSASTTRDAADVVRLMQTTSPAAIGATFARLLEHPIAASTSTEAIRFLDELFGRAGRPGILMATRALRLAMPEATVAALCIAYTREFQRAVRQSA